MSLVSYISARFNRHRTLPPSLKAMRLIAIVGIALASATLVVTLAILDGFEREYTRTILDFNAHLVLMRAGEVEERAPVDALIARAKTSQGVRAATPFMYREGLMIAHGTIKGVVVKGIDPATLRDVNPMRIDFFAPQATLESALANDSAAPPAVILGAGLAKQLQVDSATGDRRVKLLVPTTKLAKGERSFRELKVVGIFESGLYDFDAQFALMAMPAVRALFDVAGEKITGMELALYDPAHAREVGTWLESQLDASWRAVPWSELNAEIFKAVAIEKRTFSIIIGMMVVVAAFNIIGVLVLMILMRLGEIAVMRALGVNARTLARVFTRGGLATGFWGVAIGIPLGVGAAYALKTFNLVHIAPEIYFLARLPVDISWKLCGMITLFTLCVSWAISRLAAWKLTRVPIVEGLKGSD